MKFKFWRIIPIIILVGILGVFFNGLSNEKDPSFIPSVLIEKPMPSFALTAQGNNPTFSSKDFYGEAPPKVINFWASWCIPCRAEHAELEKLQKLGIKVYGISYKDSDENALKFLNKYGNIYEAIGKDTKNRVHIDFGVYKIPETFIIDNKGIIRFKQTGAITAGANFENFLKQYEAAKSAAVKTSN